MIVFAFRDEEKDPNAELGPWNLDTIQPVKAPAQNGQNGQNGVRAPMPDFNKSPVSTGSSRVSPEMLYNTSGDTIRTVQGVHMARSLHHSIW